MLTNLQRRRIDQLAEFARTATKDGQYVAIAQGGTRSIIQAIAQALDWPPETVSRTIRLIAENPQLGLSVIVTRGPEPQLLFSDHANPAGPHPNLREAANAMWRENIMRTVRSSVKTFTAYRNLTEHRTKEARRMRLEAANASAVLTNIRAFLIANDDEPGLLEQIEAALKIA